MNCIYNYKEVNKQDWLCRTCNNVSNLLCISEHLISRLHALDNFFDILVEKGH